MSQISALIRAAIEILMEQLELPKDWKSNIPLQKKESITERKKD